MLDPKYNVLKIVELIGMSMALFDSIYLSFFGKSFIMSFLGVVERAHEPFQIFSSVGNFVRDLA